jgi:membrane protein DedA with SNARE-associated domain
MVEWDYQHPHEWAFGLLGIGLLMFLENLFPIILSGVTNMPLAGSPLQSGRNELSVCLPLAGVLGNR